MERLRFVLLIIMLHQVLHLSSRSQVTPAWVARYNGISSANDIATASAMDADGNTYVTGESSGDYATVKYLPNGDTSWTRRYHGRWSDYNYATDVAVDGVGNVVVTGNEYRGNVTSSATVKYSHEGSILWARNFAGHAAALVVDNIGNVYVTGGAGTVKYSPDGDSLWFNSQTGLMAVDEKRNLFVASGTGVTKHGPGGDSLWASNFPGWPLSMTLDGGGNVYVTGNAFSVDESHILTIKYAPDGDTLWSRVYGHAHGAAAIAVNDSGNVYVSGNEVHCFWSTCGYTSVTIKYNPLGDTLWVRTGDGVGLASHLVLDQSGNIYVVGGRSTFATVKYSAAGAILWMRSYVDRWSRPSDVLIDKTGNLFVVGSSGDQHCEDCGPGECCSMVDGDFTTMKYASDGDSVWVRNYDGPRNLRDDASGLAIDGAGEVYVTGSATVKYKADGETQWFKDGASAIAVDDSGNVCVTGPSYSAGTASDFTTIKYTPAGETLWVRRYNGPGNHDDIPRAVALDESGNVVVTGSSVGADMAADFATVKYSPHGDSLWVRRYNGLPGFISPHLPTAIAVDSSNNVYVTGESAGEYATIKYNSEGDTFWVRRYAGTTPWGDRATAMAVDGAGNVYVTGESDGDYATIKYSLLGDTLWIRRHSASGKSVDHASCLKVDGSGNVVVTGGSGGDYATIKYGPDGDTVWVRTYDGAGHGDDYATGLVIDAAGDVYVTGGSWNGSYYDYATIKYASDGDSLWAIRYDGPQQDDDKAVAVAVDAAGNVYVAGSSGGDYATIKYVQSPAVVVAGVGGIPRVYALEQNYPNPFNPSTTIVYSLPEQCLMTLKVYDVLGREVNTLVEGMQTAGNYSVRWDGTNSNGMQVNSGVYFYRFQAKHFAETRKLVLIK